MQVEVREYPEFRADLVRLLERPSRSSIDTLAMAEFYHNDIRTRLMDYGGPPPGDDVRPVRRRGMWWRYMRGVWVGYTTTQERRGFLRKLCQVIRLEAVEPSLPEVPPAPV